MFKEREAYIKPSADIIVVDIDEARMIALDSTEVGSGEDETEWEVED